jgi:hypothetical protein
MSNYTRYTVTRFLFVAIIVGVLVFVLSYAAGKLTREISQKNATNAETIAMLDAQYRGINETYFSDTLTHDVHITFGPDPDGEQGVMGSASCDGNDCYINIVPKWNPSDGEKVLTLEHEMCHVKFSTSSDPDDQADSIVHGPKWQTCMLNLAAEGAMMHYW